jgi:hypothetical protein
VGLLNVNCYYDALLTLFDKAVEEGFLSIAGRRILVSAPTATELLDKMEVRIIIIKPPKPLFYLTCGSSYSSSALSRTSIRMINVQHTKLETHDG